MASLNEVPFASGVEGRQAALDAVLHSRTFAKNPRLSALLEYLCLRCFRGGADSIKEYNIATDVFGRPADFDQSTDAIVRVEMHRLRKKLKEFYAGEGEQEPIQIVISSGHYLPEFVERQSMASVAEEPEAPAAQAASWTSAEPTPAGVGRWQRAREVMGAMRVWLVLGAVIAMAAAAAILWPKRVSHFEQAAPVGEMAELPVAAVPSSESVRLLCGASKAGYRDRQGNIWGADAYYEGGTAVTVEEQPVFRTHDRFLFRTMRTGDFTYKIPLKPGVYEMRLYFSDGWYRPGIAIEGGENTRVFHIFLNGETLLRDFDIMADAGQNTADVRVFKDIQPAKDGFVHLSFARSQGEPTINAIEIVPGIPHRLRPIRLVAQDSPLTDRAGVTWYPDNYFFSGRSIARSLTVTGAEDPEIYAHERYGNFSYAIPVSEGHYRVKLRFAETYWGATSPGGGGVGTRVFDVYGNGVALLRNFDMLREAPPHTEVVKTFDNLQPNAQGKLLLSFVPVKNYANVSAIEVIDEGEGRE